MDLTNIILKIIGVDDIITSAIVDSFAGTSIYSLLKMMITVIKIVPIIVIVNKIIKKIPSAE